MTHNWTWNEFITQIENVQLHIIGNDFIGID